jgi:hypothetical protein
MDTGCGVDFASGTTTGFGTGFGFWR